jgi:hypothetical protein
MIARRWLIGATLVLAVLVASVVALHFAAGPLVRGGVVRGLAETLGGDVTLEQLDVRLLPWPAVSGRGLVVRHRGRTDVPPLVSVATFSGTATWSGVLAWRAAEVTVEGLEMVIPPRRSGESRTPAGAASPPPFTIDRVVAAGARVWILPRNREKDPRIFDIHRLDVRDVSFVSPSTFEASIANPVPEGMVETSGSFGPWDPREPSATPIDGRFTFDADLGTIKGIAGRLRASGAYSGPLDRIKVTGTTDTDDFHLPKLKARTLPLQTAFTAVVDGTNGDVLLDEVQSTLGRSRFTSRGSIAGTRGIPGKRVTLQVSADAADLGDLLRLTVPGAEPPMTGQVALDTTFDLPPGDEDVIDKLVLEGKVSIATLRFTSDAVQDRVDDLSRRGQGRPGDESIDDVVSNVTTRFEMRDGVVRLNGLRYRVRGADVAMGGAYALGPRSLDFTGVARLDASVSATQTGIRRFLLKPLDPLFRKGDAGTRIAIRLGGTIDAPKFGVDVGRTLSGK